MKPQLIIVYITCKDVAQAKLIGRALLEQRLAACANVVKTEQSMYWWPPGSKEICQDQEAILIVKTLESKYDAIETAALKLHSYANPCILAWPVAKASEKYVQWVERELS